MKVKAVVFQGKGNTFLVPGFWWAEDEVPCGWLIDAMMFGLGLGIEYEKTLATYGSTSEGDPIVACVRAEMGSNALQHGRGTVFIIAGSLFEDCLTHPHDASQCAIGER